MKYNFLNGLALSCLFFSMNVFALDVGPANITETPVTISTVESEKVDILAGVSEFSKISVNGMEVLYVQGRENRDLQTDKKKLNDLLTTRSNQLCQLLTKNPKARYVNLDYKYSPGQGLRVFKIESSAAVGQRDSSDFYRFYYTLTFKNISCGISK